MVRKGGGARAAYGLAVATTARTPVEDLGASFGAAAVARVDLSAISFELRLRLGRAHQDGLRLTSTTWESAGSVAALRVHDFGTAGRARLPAVALGLEAGLAHLDQRLDDGEQRGSTGPFFGPTAVADLSLGRRIFLRADVSLPIYMLRVQTATSTTESHWTPSLSAGIGGGAWF
jgi:hypothetical protein